MDDKKDVVVVPVVEIDPITAKDAEIAKLQVERDNYKTAALARRGKLPADSELLGEDFDVFMDEKIKTALADKELSRKEQERQAEIAKITKENAELRLALKNRPSASIGGGSGEGLEVKDNVLSEQQVLSIRQRAERVIKSDNYSKLNISDTEKKELRDKDINAFVEKAKQNILKNR